MKECEHIIQILEQAKVAAKKEDSIKLKELSDESIHSTTIYNDEDNALVAVIIYTLSKIVERGKRYYKENYKNYLNKYIEIIDDALRHLKKGDNKKFRKNIISMIKAKGISNDIKKHLEDLFRKAKINKASRVYEHGVSMEKTAKLLGISQWELAEYTGQTRISEMKQGKTIDVKERIKLAMEIFG